MVDALGNLDFALRHSVLDTESSDFPFLDSAPVFTGVTRRNDGSGIVLRIYHD